MSPQPLDRAGLREWAQAEQALVRAGWGLNKVQRRNSAALAEAQERAEELRARAAVTPVPGDLGHPKAGPDAALLSAIFGDAVFEPLKINTKQWGKYL